jgi:hypothetical protein
MAKKPSDKPMPFAAKKAQAAGSMKHKPGCKCPKCCAKSK